MVTRRVFAAAAMASTAACAFDKDKTVFHGKTLTGETFTNETLKGKAVLIQFWATWCGFCRRDQPHVDAVTREYASKGLVVLAVDVAEPRAKVEAYLKTSPRAPKIVLSSETNLVELFGARAFPTYVILNQEGKAVGAQEGAGGRIGLDDLLSRVTL